MTLDDAYANGAYIDGAETYPPRWAAEAQDFRDALGDRAKLDLTYGPSARNTFDLFLPEDDAKGLLIFVHGGYWRLFDKNSWSHLAAGALAQGWAVAMPGYDLCPDVSIGDISQQIAAAVTRIAKEVAGPISLVGHSAGGHLVARMLDKDLLAPEVGARLRKVMPISPVSDLRPLLQTSMNEDFKMDEAAAEAESPIMMQDRYEAEVTVWVGANERPSFLDQARWLAEAWDCGHVIDPAKHHFDVIDPLSDADSEMVAFLTK
ncbi:alpha/beta hydrolase [Rhodobacterales bacterium 56_14_T64]|nr:alpha/beta hydrolase [Rhodobacterales bacterium 56_14_T64]